MPRILLILFFFAWSLFSCKKENEALSWDADILAPLLKSRLSISDIITDTALLRSGTDGSVLLVHEDNLYGLGADSILTLPDTTLVSSYVMPLTLFLAPGTSIPFPANPTKYDLKGIELTDARIKSGVSIVEITSQVNEVLLVTYSIPSARLNNIPFQTLLTVPAAPQGGTVVYRDTFDLSGYEIDLRGSSGNQVNTLISSVNVTLCDIATCPGAKGDTVKAGDTISVSNSFIDIVPAYAKGYFGKNTINTGPEETVFDLFKGLSGGSLLLEKATLTLNLKNSLGVDIRSRINSLYSKNSSTGNQVNLSSSAITPPINIDRATETGNLFSPVNPTTRSIVLDNNNSNIKVLLENLPDAFGYAITSTTNPMGNLSGSNDFIYADHGLDASVKTEVPLALAVTGIVLSDTAETDMSSLKEKNRINYGRFLLHVNNGFPFDVKLQVYLLNGALAITDSLLQGNNLAYGAPVDGQGKATGVRLSILDIPVTKDKLEKIFDSEKMLIKARISTVNAPQLVRIYSGNAMDVKLIGDFNYRMELK